MPCPNRAAFARDAEPLARGPEGGAQGLRIEDGGRGVGAGARRIGAGLALCALLAGGARGQQADDPALIGELLAFHGARTIVSVMTTHCYETTGLDPAYRLADENWYLRNIGFLDLADRVIARLGGTEPGQRAAAETHAGAQIMSAYNQADSKTAFCRDFLARIEDGRLDIDEQLPGPLARAREIAAR